MQDQRQNIVSINIEDEMRNSYIDYAMSVIVGRALPDARDGLKPVHRRIIFAMNQLARAGQAYKKSARIVGDVIGKYHPHGDAAVYDAMVRMAQDFSMRYELVDGQGNFGSVDGDPPAAYRYTEARMSRFAELLMRDHDKNTVDMTPNFDGSEREPSVLPCSFPNLLVNGSQGIAVGMATSIPPHNLVETIDACCALIDKPGMSPRELMKFIPGPDFPTGGFICGRQGIREAYETGRGRIQLRARVATEQLRGGKEAVIVTEIPYGVNKSKLLEDTGAMIRDKKIMGIGEVRDESDRDGMRIVYELKKGEPAEVVINNLYKHTQLQITFPIIMLALVSNRPRYMSLTQTLQHFIDHRREVIVRRTRFDLDHAEARLHIVEGLLKALNQIAKVIALIRNSQTPEEARDRLQKEIGLTRSQAQAILDMRLQRLTHLEIDKLVAEAKELHTLIDGLKALLADEKKIFKQIKKELIEIRDRFGDKRRTEIIEAAADMDIEDLIAEENMVVSVTHAGYIKRTATSLYRSQRRGGRGVMGMDMKDEDFVEQMFVATTHNYILFFTNHGRCHWLKVYELPQGGRATRGKAIVNMLTLDPGETPQAMVPVRDFAADQYLVMVTKRGAVVRNKLDLYSNPRKIGINAIKIEKSDELIDVRLTTGNQEVFIATKNGMAVRFKEDNLRPMGRHVQGVRGITLRPGDEVIGLEILRPNTTLLTVCEYGFGKRTDVDEYRLIKRGGIGVINIKVSERNGAVVAVKEVVDDDELIMITHQGVAIRCPIKTIRTIGRSTQGVRLINLDEGDRVTSVARLGEKEEEGLIEAGTEAEEGAAAASNGEGAKEETAADAKTDE
ncbi:MAG: DNA gyrase subunit A [Candidatus Sumerlaeota bacterium]|nr:DNA gyrase subunit A [Candidatus Sumerlaeota bacterium]